METSWFLSLLYPCADCSNVFKCQLKCWFFYVILWHYNDVGSNWPELELDEKAGCFSTLHLCSGKSNTCWMHTGLCFTTPWEIVLQRVNQIQTGLKCWQENKLLQILAHKSLESRYTLGYTTAEVQFESKTCNPGVWEKKPTSSQTMSF